jgi:hypothetical protein
LEQSSELSPTLDSSGSSSGKPEVTAAKTKSIMIYTGRSVFQKTVQSE